MGRLIEQTKDSILKTVRTADPLGLRFNDVRESSSDHLPKISDETLTSLSELYKSGEIEFGTYFHALWGYESAKKVVAEHPMSANVSETISSNQDSLQE